MRCVALEAGSSPGGISQGSDFKKPDALQTTAATGTGPDDDLEKAIALSLQEHNKLSSTGAGHSSGIKGATTNAQVLVNISIENLSSAFYGQATKLPRVMS